MMPRPFPVGLQLRAAEPDDAGELGKFAARIFDDTFGQSAPAAEVAQFLAAHYGPRQQRAEIEHPGTRTRLVVDGAAIVAFYQLRLSPAEEDGRPGADVEISRFYVASEWHGRGVATPLMDAALADAFAAGARRVWLGVWEENARAIAFYRRCGFEEIGEQLFQLGSVAQRDLVMARPLPVP
jgi:ribosomal protein S18 acetylase RimI-like enzyme